MVKYLYYSILVILFLVSPVSATNYFVDSTTGSDSDNGTTMDLAWATVEHAVEAGSLVASDTIWIRRLHSETPTTSSVEAVYNGDSDDGEEISLIGWPRNTATGTADITNGYPFVFNGSVTADTEKHQARRIKNDTNNRWYFITDVVYEVPYDGEDNGGFTVDDTITTDGGFSGILTHIVDNGSDGQLWFRGTYTGTISNNDELKVSGTVRGDASSDAATCWRIDRNYAGSTVTTSNFTIQADTDYTTAQSIDDDGWTITVATWTADADDLPTIDFECSIYGMRWVSDRYWAFKNIVFKDSQTSSGILYFNSCRVIKLEGLLVQQSCTQELLTSSAVDMYIERVVFEGDLHDDGGAAQGPSLGTSGSKTILKDIASYNMGWYGALFYGPADGENINLCVEAPCDNEPMYIRASNLKLVDTNIGESPDVYHWGPLPGLRISFENFHKELGNHRTYLNIGYFSNVIAGAGTPIPDTRSGGAGQLMEVVCTETVTPRKSEWADILFTHTFYASTASKSYRYYVQSEAELAVTDLFLEVDYVDDYDSTTEYHRVVVNSDETVSTRSGITDWSQYIEVTGVQPGVASNVHIKVRCNYTHSSNKIWIDPKVYIY